MAILSPIAASWATARTMRRSQSGTVATSTADVLWDHSEKLIAALQTEVTTLVAQRDRLIDSFQQVIPLLQGLADTQERDGKLLARLVRMVTLLGGGHDGAADPGGAAGPPAPAATPKPAP